MNYTLEISHQANWSYNFQEFMPNLLKRTSLIDKLYWYKLMKTSKELAEAIHYGGEPTVELLVNNFVHSLEEIDFTKSIAIRTGFEMWVIICYSLHDKGIHVYEMTNEDENFYDNLSTIQSWAELAVFMKNRTKVLCNLQLRNENLKHRQIVEQLIVYIQENISEPITLQGMAEKFNISRNYLGKIFKDTVGESFKNYITRMRMEKAKEMIQEVQYLISDLVGYVDPAYFTKTFKKYTGYTPKDLMNNNISIC
ncbi:MAG: helix-turn-helix transcriptional regulator [Anaerobacillus sp.]|uniref:helix-turn-helix transcriptional regulator n=1 Tax=Anaerobacillus sp. TaxID=1872506 RepID=UPI00391B80E2